MADRSRVFRMKDGKLIQISKIPEGSIRVHLYRRENVLKPRGSMKKESIGLDIYDRLRSVFEEWTDTVYGDNPCKTELVNQLAVNLDEEVKAAWNRFVDDIGLKSYHR